MKRWRIAAEAVGLRAALPVMLRVLPLDKTLHALTALSARSRPAQPKHVDDVRDITDTLTRRTPGLRTACLKRALMRYVLLRRGGHAASFVIGVRPGGPDGFEAHAWVMLAGEPVMETSTHSYRQTLVWPREA